MSELYRSPSAETLDYRDDRDLAHTHVRNQMRRILDRVNAAIALEYAQARQEGRKPQVDTTREGISRLILENAHKALEVSYVSATADN